MKRLKRQKHHSEPQRVNTRGGWKKCPHPGCKFNTRSGYKLGQHIRRSHKENPEAAATTAPLAPIAPLASGKRRGRPKLHPSTMDGLDSLIASVKARLQTVEHELGKYTLLNEQRVQLEHELHTLVQTRAALEPKKN